MKERRLSVITVTEEQHSWLKNRKTVYADTYTATIRRLIQAEIKRESKRVSEG